jgi:hypothetical protein
VRHQLNHVQAEFGDYGVRGGLSFSGLITATPGVLPLAWNQYARSCSASPSYFSKDVQTEEMIGRENQFGLYVRDRWEVARNLTLNLGLRVEAYPLMNRDTRGLERLEYDTYTVLIGGFGGVPRDVGIDVQKVYLAPRVGAAWRLTEESVVRTATAAPTTRCRGRVRCAARSRRTSTSTARRAVRLDDDADRGHPAGAGARHHDRPRAAAAQRVHAVAEPDQLDRNGIDQFNVAYERRLPGRISTEIAYVHTRTDGGYADLNLNYGEPGGGNAARKYFDVAGTTNINDWANRMKSRYHALQVAVNRPFQNGFLLKGAYTLSRSKNMADEDGWTGLTWNHPAMYDQNFALAGFDRTHVFQMGWVWELPFLRETQGVLRDGARRLAGQRHLRRLLRHAVLDRRVEPAAQLPGLRLDLHQRQRRPEPVGSAGSATDPYYDRSHLLAADRRHRRRLRQQRRNAFRRPPVWNMDFSAFKAFPIGRFRPELRIETLNLFNHVNWGAPVTTSRTLRFMTFLPSAAHNATNTPGSARSRSGSGSSSNGPGPRRTHSEPERPRALRLFACTLVVRTASAVQDRWAWS